MFQDVPIAPPNPVLGLALVAKQDTHPNKIDLTVGAYKDGQGNATTLPSVRAAEKVVYEANEGHEYLKQDGLEALTSEAQTLLFGETNPILSSGRLHTIQTISGTGALRLGGDFIVKFFVGRKVFIPDTTWANHRDIFVAAGAEVGTYKYLDDSGLGLDFDGLVASLRNLPKGSVIVLQLCAQNPTGVDPTLEQWGLVLEVVKENELFPFFDNAYQGFVTGDPMVDAAPISLFTAADVPFFCAVSFSKNFGLYGERTGVLHAVVDSPTVTEAVASQLRQLSRPNYSTCPTFGARIVSTVLRDPALKAMWLADCKTIAARLQAVRRLTHDALVAKNVKGKWDHILSQCGMFTYTGLGADIVMRLRDEFHIYLLKSGRVNMAALHTGNIPYFTDALLACLGTN